ncbi:MAG: STAS domain-containing protein [Planctomycetota bacterium]|nr:STAS domain-containing protein [Planctomycetota bacterium]
MDKSLKSLRLSTVGSIHKVDLLVPHMIDEAQIRSIFGELHALAGKDAKPFFAIDFAGVAHMSSAALGALIKLDNEVRPRGGMVGLSSINVQILTVFRITKLDKHLHLFATVAESLEAIKKAHPEA